MLSNEKTHCKVVTLQVCTSVCFRAWQLLVGKLSVGRVIMSLSLPTSAAGDRGTAMAQGYG